MGGRGGAAGGMCRVYLATPAWVAPTRGAATDEAVVPEMGLAVGRPRRTWWTCIGRFPGPARRRRVIEVRARHRLVESTSHGLGLLADAFPALRGQVLVCDSSSCPTLCWRSRPQKLALEVRPVTPAAVGRGGGL